MIKLDGILESTIGSFVVLIIGGIFGSLWAQRNKKLLPFIYSNFGRNVFKVARFLIKVLISPYLRLGLIIFFLFCQYIFPKYEIWYSIFIFIVSILLLLKPKSYQFYNPVGIFNDDFSDEDSFYKKWVVKSGRPIIEKDFGKPKPDLGLKSDTPARGTNAFVYTEDIQRNAGIIECDFYLEPNSILNIVLFGNFDKNSWYMVRYDSRDGYSDGILIKNPGVHWQPLVMSGTLTKDKNWFRARVEFNEKQIKMFKNGEFIAQIENPVRFGEGIGLFNEVNDVHIDNFIIFE